MMIHPYLIRPRSIAVIGATDNLAAPGGRLLENLLKSSFKGKIYPVNPKKKELAGIPVYPDVKVLPSVDLAIIAVAAKYVEDIVKVLTEEKGTRAFIIISAGFSDAGEQGKALEERIVRQIEKFGGSLLGPNNIGLINEHYAGVFTTPVPLLDQHGVELISGSGATAVFIMEAAIKRGVRFSRVWTVGNSAQIGIEDILEHIDLNDDKTTRVLALYMENIKNPVKFLKHARSLVYKGFKLVAIKAGTSLAGTRAAASHTGAMASPDIFVDALFEKAGVLRAHGRFDLIDRMIVLQYPQADGKRVGIITHAGGPAVMLADILEKKGMEVPKITSEKKEELLKELYPGSSVENPIDILATGTAGQLEKALDFTDNYFDNIDLTAVIFGSPGLFPVYDAYDVILNKIKSGKKPLFPVFPSVVNVRDEIDYFIKKGGRVFFDEVSFGRALADVYNQIPLFEIPEFRPVAKNKIPLETESNTGLVKQDIVMKLLPNYRIKIPFQTIWHSEEDVIKADENIFPVVMKATGLNHKTEHNAVKLNIKNIQQALDAFRELKKIDDVRQILVQSYIPAAFELFAGVKYDEKFGHLLMFGKGGVEIEIWKDIQQVLIPASRDEILWKLKKLKIFPLFKRFRNREPLPLEPFLDLLENVQQLVYDYPQIKEMDLNPVLVKDKDIFAVDIRIKI